VVEPPVEEPPVVLVEPPVVLVEPPGPVEPVPVLVPGRVVVLAVVVEEPVAPVPVPVLPVPVLPVPVIDPPPVPVEPVESLPVEETPPVLVLLALPAGVTFRTCPSRLSVAVPPPTRPIFLVSPSGAGTVFQVEP
jgi:hypothetical protein